MKVLQVNAVYGVGSTGVIVRDIHELCLKEGIESYVAYSTSPVAEDEIPGGFKIGNTIGKKLHAFLCRINGMQAYFSRYSTRKFLKYIKKLQPDIVQLHNLHSNYIHLNMLLQFLAKENIKTVVTLHDCWFHTGGCFHYTAIGCDKWLKECGACPKKQEDTKAYWLDRSAKILRDRKKYFSAINDLTVVGVSNWLAGEAGKTFFQEKKIMTIHNGVDTTLFQPTSSDFREQHGLQDKFVILGPASKFLSPVNKEIFESIVASLKEDEAFVLLGCTKEQKKNLPEAVIGIPFIKDREELCKIYSAVDVFVNCTREDALSSLNLEPQACGTPVITFGNTGAKETVDNQCGFTVETGNAEEMKKKIRCVKNLGKDALSEACRSRILNYFKKEENYQRYIEIYKSAM
jgi:glycosyltransferase involved in cell wall biosynthesis